MCSSIVISASVEGITDEAAVRRLVAHVGAGLGDVYGKNGKRQLRNNIRGYNQAARYWPWIVLVDLNSDADCAPELRRDWLPDPSRGMCFRVAVRELEAWLLADRQALAAFLSVRPALMPPDPEELEDPKRFVIDLARRSSRRAIREDMVPRPGSGRLVGPAYPSRVIEFISQAWRPDVAAENSESLRESLERLESLLRAWSARVGLS
jgi:hypothetical protein